MVVRIVFTPKGMFNVYDSNDKILPSLFFPFCDAKSSCRSRLLCENVEK